MHVVIQRYRVRLGAVTEAARYANKWFLPLLRQIPGFGACCLMAAGDRILACIGVFETAAGVDTAVRLAQEWFGKEWGSFRPLPPEVIAGEVLTQTAATGQTETGRRWIADRRNTTVLVAAGSSSESERRSGHDRRRGFDRRADFAPLFEQQAAG
jgi:hypothetical protein